MTTTTIVELIDVWKNYNVNSVLKGINLRVEEGEFISIRGKSGVGKTTLLKIIGLLEPLDRGRIKILGRDASELNDDEKSYIRLKGIGFIFQFFNLIPTLTVIENIELPLALLGVNKFRRKKRALELLDYFDLKYLAYRFPTTLSGGERQRVAIIRALVNNPRIILADEPTTSLDDENTRLVHELLEKINKERNITIIMTTTDLYEKLPTHRDYILKDGRLYELL